MEQQQHKYKTSPRPICYKSFGSSIEVANRKVSGYLAHFNSKDSDQDVIIKGAFAKSLTDRGVGSGTNRKIAYLWQHQMKEPIGRFTQLKEDDVGLYFEAEVDDIPLGDRVLAQYASGTLNQHSIGFKYVWDKTIYDEAQDAFLLKEVNLFEGSVVTMGANENTPFMGMKGFDRILESEILTRDTEKFLKSLPHNLEYEARQLIAKHIALSESEPVEKSTHVKSEPQQFDIETAIKNAKLF
jgi:hypothetical protein